MGESQLLEGENGGLPLLKKTKKKTHRPWEDKGWRLSPQKDEVGTLNLWVEKVGDPQSSQNGKTRHTVVGRMEENDLSLHRT